MKIFGQKGETHLQEVVPGMMECNKHYVIEQIGFDDASGDETVFYDIIYLMVDSVPGQTKAVKTMRFCSVPKQVTFSQVPGSKFYGPINMMHSAIMERPEEDEGMNKIISQAAKRTQNGTGN